MLNPRRTNARAVKLATTLATLGAIAALTGSTANATSCTPAGSCDSTGTLTVSPGSLHISSPGTLAWTATLNGLDQKAADTADGTFVVNDATGSAAGWHVNASATAFTCAAGSSATCGTGTLPGTGLSANASTTDATATAGAPTAACTVTGSGCALPTNSVTYPQAISATAVPLFNAAIGTGMGSITVSGLTWWLDVPANAKAGSYTSTITLAAVSAP